MNTAKLHKRVIAYLIDIVIISAPIVVGLIWLFYFINMEYNYATPWYFMLIGGLLIQWIIYTFLSTLIMFIFNGRTFGNALLGIKIIHADNRHLSFKDCLCISAVHGLLIMVIINLFYILIVHTEKSVSDRLTDTIAVDWRHRNREN